MNRNNNLFPQLHFLSEEQEKQTSNYSRQPPPPNRYPQHHQPQFAPNPNPRALSATQPLPTHHPLQLLQWDHHDQKNGTWQVDKYNRLSDTRKQPMTIERGYNDRLILQFKDEQSKAICVYHNYNELETFCIHPILFSHDLISKDCKLLFCVKDQIDGSIRYKFRLKFPNPEMLHTFCAAVAGYVTIKTYEEWGHRNTSTYSDMSICSDNSTLSDFSSTAGNRSQLLPLQQLRELNGRKKQTDENNVVISANGSRVKIPSPRISPIPNRSRSTDDLHLLGKSNNSKNERIENRQMADVCTQTDAVTFANLQEHELGTNFKSKSDSGPINVNISNLISVEAVREFGHILADAINVAVQNQQHHGHIIEDAINVAVQNQQQHGHIIEDAINVAVQNQQQHGHIIEDAINVAVQNQQHHQQPPVEIPVPQPNAPKKAKKRHKKPPSLWKSNEEQQRMRELIKHEKQKMQQKHRRSSQSIHHNYLLRGCSPNPDLNDVSMNSTDDSSLLQTTTSTLE